jgi:hypothetical protein
MIKGLSLSSLRVGKKYRLVNHGEVHDFEIERSLGNNDFNVKDLLTLERYRLKDLIAYGKGDDFEIEEI